MTCLECLWVALVFVAQGNDSTKKKKKNHYFIFWIRGSPVFSLLSFAAPVVYLEYS